MDVLRASAARVVALSNGANLAFVGRTPENYYDYLSGAFAHAEDAPGLALIPFSLRWAGPDGLDGFTQAQRRGLFKTLTAVGVNPARIAAADRPLALVDFVVDGGTMQNLIGFMRMHADHDGVDWNAVQRRLRLIGLRIRTKNSPNTDRWQQHQYWLDQIPDARIKNVSVPAWFLYQVGNWQPKVTDPFTPNKWDKDVDDVTHRQGHQPTEDQRRALAFAVALYDRARQREERRALAGAITKTVQMRQPATREVAALLRR